MHIIIHKIGKPRDFLYHYLSASLPDAEICSSRLQQYCQTGKKNPIVSAKVCLHVPCRLKEFGISKIEVLFTHTTLANVHNKITQFHHKSPVLTSKLKASVQPGLSPPSPINHIISSPVNNSPNYIHIQASIVAH